MELGTFTPKVFGEGDRVKAQDLAGVPLIVNVKEVREGMKTQYAPEGGKALFVDIADVKSDTVYISVLWMNRQIVDQLSEYLERPLPIKISWIPSPKGGNPFLMPEPLEGNELQMAVRWASQNDGRFESELEKRKSETVADTPALSIPSPAVKVTAPELPTLPVNDRPLKAVSNAPVVEGVEVTPEMIAAVQALQQGESK